MAQIDTTLYVDRFEDEARPNPDGQTVTNFRTVRFRLGKFGPFVERFPRETFTDVMFSTRVDELRRQLEAIHR